MRCRIQHRWLLPAALFWAAQSAFAVTLAEKARESGCVNKPVAITSGFYKCSTPSGGEAFFNVPGAAESPASTYSGTKATATPTPPGFQRVDPATQKGRDDVRRKVLGEELATEEQLLVEARASYNNGAPTPLPEESTNAEKYRERIARYRQAVQLHERNIEALKKELGNTK
jgi:hypothetical protein